MRWFTARFNTRPKLEALPQRLPLHHYDNAAPPPSPVEAQEQTLIHNLLDFDELTVSQVMRPWSEVCWLSSNAPLEEVFTRLEGQPFSRIPVLASAERVIGIVYTKTLLAARWGLAEPRPLTELLRSPLLTRPEEPADALMAPSRSPSRVFSLCRH